MSSTSLLVVVPLYKQPELLPALFQSLINVADEIVKLNASVLLINDSPDDSALGDALLEQMPALQAAVPVRLHVNAENLGFVRSCNYAMAQALQTGADILLLNSDALVTSGALTEMAEVALLDPMISVVSPRSNNATICNSPYPDIYRSLDLSAAHKAHLSIQRYLPRFTYVPTAVGFCLYIRHGMLAEFGDFDLIYGGGYNEENDFIFRCNRSGYRAVLANHAFVFHIGSVSFASSTSSSASREAENAVILHKRYPEYPLAIKRYFNGIEFKAQTLLAGLVLGQNRRLKLLFDCRNIGPYHNGTFEHAKNLIKSFVHRYSDRFDCYIACNHDALVFHEFDKITWLKFCWNKEHEIKPFAVVFRCAQPFDHDTLVNIGSLAPVTGYLMLDTIAMDCLHLDDRDFHSLWFDFIDTTSLIVYNSGFTADQFARRFSVPNDVVQIVSRCSTDVRDYVAVGASRSPVATGSAAGDGYILLVGNHFPHKNVETTVSLLRGIRARPRVIVLGADIPDADGIVGYRSGELDQAFVDELYEHASLLLFPSHYEGFGLPVVHALARRVPVIARDVPLFREIRNATPHGKNIHLCKTTAEMVATAISHVDWIEETLATPAQGWDEAADALAEGVENALAGVSFDQLCRRLRRLENRRLLSNEDAENRVQWLREVSILLSRLPGWWWIMPLKWQLTQKHRRLRSRNLFDADAYLARYPDVAKSGIDPLDHYIVHGIGEGRILV